MVKLSSQFVLAWIAALAISGACQADWAPNDAQQEAIEAINAIRRDQRLPEYRLESRLSKAAAAHSVYANNYQTDHDEKPGLAGFTGATPADRVRAAGYPSGAGEVMNYHLDSMGVTMAIRELLDTPYHRGLWMLLGSADVGAGVFGSTLTVDFRGVWREGAIVYPYDGQKGVPISWSKGETPDPRRVWRLPRRIGYPINYHWEASPRDDVTVASASVTEKGGGTVDTVLNTAQNDIHLVNGDDAIILPRRPLKAHTTYTVKVSARTKSGRDVSREWTFTTGAAEITERRESQTEAAMNISFLAEPGPGNSVIVRVINLDAGRQRVFTVKARNATGDLLASSRLKVPPSTLGTVQLLAKEDIRTVVLALIGPDAQTPITRVITPRVGGWRRRPKTP